MSLIGGFSNYKRHIPTAIKSMMYFYIKALHIIFIVTWFSGMFYIVRLFIYNTEANELPEQERAVLQRQFSVMIRRLWLGITWPSAILTLFFGGWVAWLLGGIPNWLWVKLGFVAGLYAYHFSLQLIYREQLQGKFRFSSNQLRIWNEVATIFLVAIIILATVKTVMSWGWGVGILLLLSAVLMGGIQIYKRLRKGEGNGSGK